MASRPDRPLHQRVSAVVLRTGTIAACFYLAYVALAILLVNPLLNDWAPRLYHQQTGRALRFDELFLNPFTLALRARAVSDRATTGEPLWSVDRMTVNASIASLWRFAVVLDEVTVTGVRVNLVQTAPDRWNFSDVLAWRERLGGPAEPEPQEGEASLPHMHIASITVGIEQLAVHAPYFTEPFAASVSDIGVAARDFSTAAGDTSARHRSWATLGAEAIGLHVASIGVESLRKEDSFATHLDQFTLYLDRFGLAAAEGQPFALALTDEGGGHLYWRGTFALEQRHADGYLAVKDIGLRPLWQYLAPRFNFRIASGNADLALDYVLDWSGDTLRYRIGDGKLALDGLNLTAPTPADSEIGFQRLSMRGLALDSETQRVNVGRITVAQPTVRGWNEGAVVSLQAMFERDDATPENADEQSAWRVDLAELRLRDGRIDWQASQVEQPLALRDVDIAIDNFSWPATHPAALELDAQLNEQADLSLAGELHLATLDGGFQGKLSELPLALTNAALAEVMALTIASGSLSAEWELRLDGGEPTLLSTGGHIADLEVRRTDRDRQLLAWERLQWVDLDANTAGRRLSIKEIDLNQPWLRFQITPDGMTNFSQLAVSREGQQPAEKAAPAANQNTADANEADGAADPSWEVAVDSIHIDNGTLLFADRSLPYPFRARIQAFTGDIVGVSSDAERPAEVDLRGNLADYAPVTLAGRAALLAEQPQLDLALTFSEVDMALLNPYARSYAGYGIDSGLLTVELAYNLEGERIRGSNRVVVRQLALGEPVESPKAVDLPIRLALALLTNRQGVIDLNVDVSGDLGDPQFGLGDIVRRAFFNAVGKVALSPFRFLGSLIGADSKQAEALGQFKFGAGEAELDPVQQAKLVDLKRALDLRPQLQLHIVGHIDPRRDAEALRKRELNQRLLAAGVEEEAIEARDDSWREALAALFTQQFPNRASDELSAAEQVSELLATIEIPPRRLRGLALRRAQAVKQGLVAGVGASAGRVFIDANSARTDKVAAPRATLRLEG